eukprot:gene5175-18399_t
MSKAKSQANVGPLKEAVKSLLWSEVRLLALSFPLPPHPRTMGAFSSKSSKRPKDSISYSGAAAEAVSPESPSQTGRAKRALSGAHVFDKVSVRPSSGRVVPLGSPGLSQNSEFGNDGSSSRGMAAPPMTSGGWSPSYPSGYVPTSGRARSSPASPDSSNGLPQLPVKSILKKPPVPDNLKEMQEKG